MPTDQPLDEEIKDSIPSVAIDGHDIRITLADEDVRGQPNAKVDLVFYQSKEDGKQSVASIRMSLAELRDLKRMMERKDEDCLKAKAKDKS